MLLQVLFLSFLVTISAPAFKKEKYVNDLTLTLHICGQKVEAIYKKYYEWNFPAIKV